MFCMEHKKFQKSKKWPSREHSYESWLKLSILLIVDELRTTGDPYRSLELSLSQIKNESNL